MLTLAGLGDSGWLAERTVDWKETTVLKIASELKKNCKNPIESGLCLVNIPLKE